MEGSQLRMLDEHCIKAKTAFFARCDSLADLSAVLGHADVRWMWVDVYLDVKLTPARGQASDDQAISPASLWNKAFRPWLSWIR
jgi:hypothetical protein